MKTASAKAKGRKAQQYVRDLLLEHSSNLTPDDIRSTSMGASGSDLLLSQEALIQWPYYFEVKNQEKVNIWAAYEQAEKGNKNPNLDPLVVIKRNKSKYLAVLELDVFLEIQSLANAVSVKNISFKE